MRIRTHIFSWVFLATIVPLITLVIAATYYLEYDYQNGIKENTHTSLANLSSELNRHLESQRELALGLSRSIAVQDFLPMMQDAEEGNSDTDFVTYRDELNRYFEGFQTILPGMYVMRIMDRRGNSYIKVSHNFRSSAEFESLNGATFVEQEVNSADFEQFLLDLPRDDVSVVVLPHNDAQAEFYLSLPLLDYIIPLYREDELVGAFSLTLFGESVDRILLHSPRLYDAKLFVTEDNPEDEQRYGLMLYDDDHKIRLAQLRPETNNFEELYGSLLFEKITADPFGLYQDDDTKESIFYLEFFPYPSNNLTTWVLGLRIETNILNEPFQLFRLVVWTVAGIALLISLLLGNIGVRTISRPIQELASNLLSYARGEKVKHINSQVTIDEIRDLESAFNTMYDELNIAGKERDKATHMMLQSSKLASIGQMAAGIGHELNNPLNNILSYAKLLERTNTNKNENLSKDLHSLKEEAVRASEIVRGILNFARQVPPHYAPFSVHQWILDTLNLVRQSANTAGIELEYDDKLDVVIEGDRGQLQQALINLLINAIQASSRDDVVKIHVHITERDVIISVIDNGSGIQELELENIYDPFFTTKPEGEGSGLGLSVSLGIIERHEGKLVIANNSDAGVTATLILPIKAQDNNKVMLKEKI